MASPLLPLSGVRNIVKLVFANMNELFYYNQEVVEGQWLKSGTIYTAVLKDLSLASVNSIHLVLSEFTTYQPNQQVNVHYCKPQIC